MSTLKNVSLNLADIEDIFADLHESTHDRTIAIVAVETIASLAKQAIGKHLSCDKASRILNTRSAFELLQGVLPAIVQKELGVINEIRNDFAHCPLNVTFDHPEISSKVEKLKLSTPQSAHDSLSGFNFEIRDDGTEDLFIVDSLGFHMARLKLSPSTTAKGKFLHSATVACSFVIAQNPTMKPASYLRQMASKI